MTTAKEIAAELVKAGGNVLWTPNGFYPESGFYKSDGCARIVDEDGGAWLLSRYDRRTKVESVADVVRESYCWWVMSRKRASFWETPSAQWLELYMEFVEDWDE